MLTLTTLKTMHKGLQDDHDRAAAQARALDDAIQKYKVDGSLRPDWIAEKIREARKQHLPLIAERIRGFDERLAIMVAQKRYWQNKLLILSLQRPSANPLNDAIIAGRYLCELSAMPAAVLQLVADGAKEDKDLPLLWQCILAGQQRTGEAGWSGIDLSDVEIPDQKTALDLIATAEGIAWSAHSMFSVASGGVLTGADKLTLARIQQGRNAPTKHNSEGRPAPA